MRRLGDLISGREEWLEGRILELMGGSLAPSSSPDSFTINSLRHLLLAISSVLKKSLDPLKTQPEALDLSPVLDQAEVSRKDGQPLPRFLSLLKFHRWAYADLIGEIPAREGEEVRKLLHQFFDRLELAVAGYWGLAERAERKEADQNARYLSFHDRLTGLFNQAFFEEELMRLDTDRQLPISLIFGDLNCLRLIVNAFGREEGDRLLVKLAGILKSSLRREDIVSCLGKGEFGVILPCMERSVALDICGRIRRELRRSFDGKYMLSMALGVATKTSVHEDIRQVLEKAREEMRSASRAESKAASRAMIESFERSLWQAECETEDHARSLHELVLAIGKQLDLPQDQLDDLGLLAILHDIGKVAMLQEVLLKPERLTPAEWESVRRHPEVGYRIASFSPDLTSIAEGILSHHERWDGSGYPHGLKGDDIPLQARIVALADAYDVMLRGSSYREARSKEEVISELRRCSGTQFDPNLVKVFIRLIQ